MLPPLKGKQKVASVVASHAALKGAGAVIVGSASTLKEYYLRSYTHMAWLYFWGIRAIRSCGIWPLLKVKRLWCMLVIA